MNDQPRSRQAAELSRATVLRGAVTGGLINACINGAIQWFSLRDRASIPLSVDAITNAEQTVLGMAVPLAVSISMILTVIAYVTLKVPKQPFWPSVLWLTIKHGLFVFGLIVASAVVWQRSMGSVTVSLATAVIVLGVLAGGVGATVNYMTIHASVLRRL